MVTLDDIYAAYLNARSNKRRSDDCIEFEIHLERNIVRLCDAINCKTFEPTAYTFVTSRPKPREVFAADFATRVVHHYIDMRLRPLIEDGLTSRTYNNRVGYGSVECINTFISDIYEVTEGYTRQAWIFSADLSGYFPNASQHRAYDQLTDLINRRYLGDDKEDLLYMVERTIFSYPQLNCFRKSPIWMWEDIPNEKSLFRKPPGIGAAIGHLIWQNEMNYYLNDFDHFNVDVCHFHYVRFVDDMRWVTTNKEMMLAMFPVFRRMLADAGCHFNEHKFGCQDSLKGNSFIGKYIKGRGVYATPRTRRNFTHTIHQFNNCVRASKIDTVLASLNSYTGILKNIIGDRDIAAGIDILNPEWSGYIHFNRERKCFQANEGYRTVERRNRRFDIKPHSNNGRL